MALLLVIYALCFFVAGILGGLLLCHRLGDIVGMLEDLWSKL